MTREDFDWAVRKATAKKKQDFSKAEFFSYEEGLCVQCMHIGAYDDEPVTVDAMHRFYGRTGIHIGYNGSENAPRNLSERCEEGSTGETEDCGQASNKDYGKIGGKRYGINKGVFGFCYGTIIRTG